MSNALPERQKPAGLYANFPSRLNAISTDLVVLVLFSVGVFSLSSVLQHADKLRVGLVILWWLTILFYEPLFVWLGGGTIGHRLMNLRVVDNRTGGRGWLLRALTR